MATHVAVEGFAFRSHDGMPRCLKAGDLVDDSDPDFKGREHLFQPADQATADASLRRGQRPGSTQRAAETATAGPGEKRTRSMPLPPAAKDPADDEHVVLPTKPPVADK